MSIRNLVNQITPLKHSINIFWIPYSDNEDYIILSKLHNIIIYIKQDIIQDKLHRLCTLPFVKELEKDSICDFVLFQDRKVYEVAKKFSVRLQIPLVLMLHGDNYPKIETKYLYQQTQNINFIICPNEEIEKQWMVKANVYANYHSPSQLLKAFESARYVANQL